MTATVRVIVITGSMGAGKTTVLGEASDLLAAHGIAHAAIDLDALGVSHLTESASSADLAYANLRSIWANYAAAGARHVLVAAAVESRSELDRLSDALPHAELVVCRLHAPLETMEERVRLREPGMHQEKFVGRVADLERLLDAAALENFTLTNTGSVTDVAREMLVKAGWC
jgi:adenylylsulfate kinase-like enzyme